MILNSTDPVNRLTSTLTSIDKVETSLEWQEYFSGQNHLARHSKRGKKTRQTEEEVGRQQRMDRPEVREVQEGCGEPGKMEETGCEIICDAPTTLAVKG